MDAERRAKLLRGFALGGTYGFVFLGSVLLGAGVGWWLDRWIGLPPVVLTLILGLAGAVVGFVAIVRASAGGSP